MTDFNLETECREARNRLHRSIGQLSRQAKVRCLANCAKIIVSYPHSGYGVSGNVRRFKPSKYTKVYSEECKAYGAAVAIAVCNGDKFPEPPYGLDSLRKTAWELYQEGVKKKAKHQ